jgi:hypothetical protein
MSAMGRNLPFAFRLKFASRCCAIAGPPSSENAVLQQPVCDSCFAFFALEASVTAHESIVPSDHQTSASGPAPANRAGIPSPAHAYGIAAFAAFRPIWDKPADPTQSLPQRRLSRARAGARVEAST